MKIIPGTLAVLLAMSVLAGPSAADERDHRRGAERGRHERPRVEIHHRFNDRDRVRWRAGHWHRGKHAGRTGWWWIAGGVWHYYAAPVYPYPIAYPAPLVTAPAAAQFWYYCSNPAGYYPTVPACRAGWQRVPAAVLPGVVP